MFGLRAPLTGARRRLAPAATVLAALVLTPAGGAASLDEPSAAEIGQAAGIADGVLRASAVDELAAAAVWGGRFRTAGGETVTMWFSDSYAQDVALAQRWVDFVGSLVHGAEISRMEVYVLPLREVQAVCGEHAAACYSSYRATIVTPGEDLSDGTAAEAILAHEYGHQVAAHRTNAPWRALDYGTKRWASYEKICSEARSGRLFPGAEDARNYALNPGEGFAEAYRVLSERRLGLSESIWEIVSSAFYPDATALALLEQDVLTPWRANRRSTVRSSFARRGARARTHVVATPYDGTLAVSLNVVRRARVRLDVLTGAGRSLGSGVASGRTVTVRSTACGSRSLRLRVTRLAGAGAYRLTVSRP